MGQLDGLRAIAVFAVIAQNSLAAESLLSGYALGTHAVHLCLCAQRFPYHRNSFSPLEINARPAAIKSAMFSRRFICVAHFASFPRTN